MTRTHEQFLPEGTKIGVYEIKNVLQHDAFSVSYRALNHHMKGEVVLTEYFPQSLAERAQGQLEIQPISSETQELYDFGLKAFLQQGETLLHIEHPDIVPTENILEINGTAYLMTTHQSGVPLSKLDNKPDLFGDTEAKFILTSILSALESVHEHGIIHGDIRPDVISLDKKGEPKLSGFSAARLALAQRENKLDSELASNYAPREQYDANIQSEPTADFYALAATLLYCMSQAEPTAAKKRMASLKKEGVDPIESQLSALSSTYSADLLATIQRMMSLNAIERPQSVSEILSALNTESDTSVSTEEAEQPEITLDDDDDSSPSKLKSLILAGATLGVLGLVAYTFWDKIFPQQTDELAGKAPDTVAIAPQPAPVLPDPVPAPETADTADGAAEQRPIQQSDANRSNDGVVEQTTEIIEQTTAAIERPVTEMTQTIVEQAVEIPIAKNTDLPAVEPVSQAESVVQKTEPEAETTPSQAALEQSARIPDQAEIAGRSIEQNLASAETAMREYRLTTPIGNSAYTYYHAILAVQPNHPKATAGLTRIVNQYVQLIDKALREDNVQNARVYLRRAERIQPDHANLAEYREVLLER